MSHLLSSAREQVSNELRQVLAEKERLLLEAANLFREAESVHAAREEAASSEKADVETELEVIRWRLIDVRRVLSTVLYSIDSTVLFCTVKVIR